MGCIFVWVNMQKWSYAIGGNMVENKNKLEKYVFLLVTSVGQRKNSESPLSHRDSTVSKVYCEVHITCVVHTARSSISYSKT